MRHVLGRAIRLHRERAGLTAEQCANRRTCAGRAAERLLFGPPLGAGEARQLQKRYWRLWDSLFTFLHISSELTGWPVTHELMAPDKEGPFASVTPEAR